MVEANELTTQMRQLLESLKSVDNNVRKDAEAQLTELRTSNARHLYQGFMAVIQAGTLEEYKVTALACLLLKKLFLDGRK